MRIGARRRGFLLAGLVFLIAIVGVAAWFLLDQKPGKADIRQALDEATDALSWPGRDIETAATTLATPEAAADFLRNHVRETAYPGAVFDPSEILALRTGNRIDRARLLEALILAMGLDARLISDGSPSALVVMPPEAFPAAYQKLVDVLEIDRAAVMAARAADLADTRSGLENRFAVSEARLREVFELPSYEVGPQVAVPRVWVETTDSEGNQRRLGLGAAEPPVLGETYIADPATLSLRLMGIGRDGRRHTLLEYDGPVRAALNLSFQPNVGPADAFGKPPAPETVAAWAPVLSYGETVVSGRVFTPAGELPPDNDGAAPLAPQTDPSAPEIDDLALIGIDTSAWPEIRARLSASLPDDTPWQAAYLKLSDGGTPKHLRVSELPLDSVGARPLVLMIDTSASMAEGWRAFHARDLARAVLEELPDGIPLQIVSISGEAPRTTREMAPLSDRDEAIEQIDATFILNNALPLSAAVDALTSDTSDPLNMLFLGDGAVADPGAVAEVLADRNAQIFSVAIGASTTGYAEMGSAWSWNSEDAPEGIAATLVSALDNKLEIAWTAPEGTPEEVREVSIAPAAGRGPPIETTYVVPEAAAPVLDDRIAALALELTLPGQEGSVDVQRPLLTLGPEASPWGLEMQGRIGIAPGPSPDRVLAGAYLDEWRALFDAQQAAAENRALALPSPGPGVATMQRIDGLFALAEMANDGALATSAPLVFFERLDPQVEENGDLVLRRTLDVLYDGGLTDRSSDPWRAGLALAEAEAALLATDSVNQRLIGAEDARAVGASDIVPEWIEAALGATSTDGTQYFASRGTSAAWVLGKDGRLEARLLSPMAKGATAAEIAGEFRALRSRLELIGIFSGAAGSMAGLSGIPHGGIIGILDQNLRLWCFSSVMMGYVGDEIAGLPTPGDGDPAVWEATAQSLCELGDPRNLARAYAAAMASGMVSGYAGDVLAQRQLFGSGFAAGFTNNVFWNSVVSVSGLGSALYEALRRDE